MSEKEVAGPINRGRKGISFLRLDARRKGKNEAVRARHILIRIANNNKDSARAEALKILKMAKSGKDFAELARKYSKDVGSARRGGDLGYFARGTMVKPFEKAAFAAKPGQIVGPVETEFGYHIIKIIDKKSDEIKYSEILLKPYVSTDTRNQIMREAYSIQKQAEKGVPFDTLAARLNLTTTYSGYVAKDQPLLGSEYFTHLVFSNELGTVLEPLELKPYGVIVAMVDDIRQGGFAPLELAKPEITEILKHRKKLAKLAASANAFYDKFVKNLTELKDLDQSQASSKVRTADNYRPSGNLPGIGVDNVFAAKVFEVPTGKIIKPFQGERGWYIVQVYNRYIPKTDKKTLDNFRKSLLRANKQKAFYDWFESVRKNAVIEDYRYEFYKDY